LREGRSDLCCGQCFSNEGSSKKGLFWDVNEERVREKKIGNEVEKRRRHREEGKGKRIANAARDDGAMKWRLNHALVGG